ncbi:hypothetical protein PFLUV_G00058360 [Perca fluviatilis]|uniref:Uncharacterized protein n=1 Tax=Perca fluviatilis TaxID=8168 RepID=A0A6A5FHD4_PERFL|nr:hypothetical protein PFLUV_G00058360 [Perca fluviatilis]
MDRSCISNLAVLLMRLGAVTSLRAGEPSGAERRNGVTKRTRHLENMQEKKDAAERETVSEPLTSDPQAGSPAGQEPGGGRRGERRGGRSVIGGCQLPPLAMDTAFTAAAIATGRDGRESRLQRAAGMELSLL